MTKHELRTWPVHYAEVIARRKRCELRKDDRGFRVGDALVLREWDPDVQGYTGAATIVNVTHIISDVPHLGLEAGYVVMSITDPLS